LTWSNWPRRQTMILNRKTSRKQQLAIGNRGSLMLIESGRFLRPSGKRRQEFCSRVSKTFRNCSSAWVARRGTLRQAVPLPLARRGALRQAVPLSWALRQAPPQGQMLHPAVKNEPHPLIHLNQPRAKGQLVSVLAPHAAPCPAERAVRAELGACTPRLAASAPNPKRATTHRLSSISQPC